MRALLTWFITLQLSVGPVAAQLGEKKDVAEFNPTSQLAEQLALHEAQAFSKIVDTEMAKLKSLGALDYVKSTEHLSAEDKAHWQKLAQELRGEGLPGFSQKAPGEWSLTVSGKTLAFGLSDLYQKKVFVNGKFVSLSAGSLKELEARLRTALASSASTTSILPLLLRQFAIGEAHAEPVSGAILLLIAAVVGAILAGSAWYYMKFKPKKAVEALRQAAGTLAGDAAKCEEARADSDSYNATFDLAANISERTRLNSLTSAERSLQLVIKEQIDTATRRRTDCYDAAHEAGKHLSLDIPKITDAQLERLELMGGSTKLTSETDVKGALFGVCAAYNRLASCMSRFVAAHIDDSGMSSFKDNARRSHYRYQQQSAAGQR